MPRVPGVMQKQIAAEYPDARDGIPRGIAHWFTRWSSVDVKCLGEFSLVCWVWSRSDWRDHRLMQCAVMPCSWYPLVTPCLSNREHRHIVPLFKGLSLTLLHVPIPCAALGTVNAQAMFVANVCMWVGLVLIVLVDAKILMEQGPEPVLLYNPDTFALFLGAAVVCFEGIGLVLPVRESIEPDLQVRTLIYPRRDLGYQPSPSIENRRVSGRQ